MHAALPKTSAETPAPVRTTDPVDARTQQIYAMADEGRTPVEIASALEDQIGKIELILALRSSRS